MYGAGVNNTGSTNSNGFPSRAGLLKTQSNLRVDIVIFELSVTNDG